MSVNKFYCCGKLTFTSLLLHAKFLKAEKDCKTPGCCQNTKTSYKVKDSHLFSSKQEITSGFLYLFIDPKVNIVSIFYHPQGKGVAYNSHAPPYIFSNSLYTINCNFRI